MFSEFLWYKMAVGSPKTCVSSHTQVFLFSPSRRRRRSESERQNKFSEMKARMRSITSITSLQDAQDPTAGDNEQQDLPTRHSRHTYTWPLHMHSPARLERSQEVSVVPTLTHTYEAFGVGTTKQVFRDEIKNEIDNLDNLASRCSRPDRWRQRAARPAHAS